MQRSGFTFLICPDSELLRLRIDELLAAHPPAGGVWQRHVFWGDDDLPRDFWEHLTLQGLFAEDKALVIRRAENLSAAQWKTLSKALGSVSHSVWPLVCLEVPTERGKSKIPAHVLRLACYEFAGKRKWVENIPALDARTMPDFVQKAARKSGLNITVQEARTLAANLLPDAALINSEMAKLTLAAGADGRLPKDAASLLDHNPEVHIFEMISAIQGNTRQLEVWRQILNERLGGDMTVFGFISLLLREARVLWQILAGSPPSLPPSVLGKKRVIAQGLGFPAIARIFEFLLTAEKGIKTGERSPEQAFDILTADLFRLFGSHGRR